MDEKTVPFFRASNLLRGREAQTGNPTMLIWLGKQLLGQRDKHELEQTGTQTLQFQHLVAARASSEQIHRERAANGWAIADYAPDVPEPPLIDLLQPALE